MKDEKEFLRDLLQFAVTQKSYVETWDDEDQDGCERLAWEIIVLMIQSRFRDLNYNDISRKLRINGRLTDDKVVQ